MCVCSYVGVAVVAQLVNDRLAFSTLFPHARTDLWVSGVPIVSQ